jgi:hypothetical protein
MFLTATDHPLSRFADFLDWRGQQIFNARSQYTDGLRAEREFKPIPSTEAPVGEAGEPALADGNATTLAEDHLSASFSEPDAVLVAPVSKVKESGIKFPHVPTPTAPSAPSSTLDVSVVTDKDGNAMLKKFQIANFLHRTVRLFNFDRWEPKMVVFLRSTEATPCGHRLK